MHLPPVFRLGVVVVLVGVVSMMLGAQRLIAATTRLVHRSHAGPGGHLGGLRVPMLRAC